MNKLYIFGIGGTGSRVLKSLTMLLAAGVKCDYDIVPIYCRPRCRQCKSDRHRGHIAKVSANT
jgi:hypothetical protein